jgi:hypothetical protein
MPSDIEAEMPAEARERAIRYLCEVERAPEGLKARDHDLPLSVADFGRLPRRSTTMIERIRKLRLRSCRHSRSWRRSSVSAFRLLSAENALLELIDLGGARWRR